MTSMYLVKSVSLIWQISEFLDLALDSHRGSDYFVYATLRAPCFFFLLFSFKPKDSIYRNHDDFREEYALTDFLF